MRISDWSSDVCSSDLGDWQPSTATLERASRCRPDVDVAGVLEKFRTYHDSRSVLHPDRSFQLWILRERGECHVPTPGSRRRDRADRATRTHDAGGAVDSALLRFRLRRGRALE